MTITTAGRVQQVVAGREAQLELRVRGATNGTAAQFEVFKASDNSSIETLDGQVQRGKAVTTWTAVGPDEAGTARSHRVYYVVTIDGARTTSPELEVYHDSVEVTSQDADGAALADMRFTLTVRQGRRAARTVRGSTGSTGTLVVANLPPGDVSVEWRSPARLIEWAEETAKKRTAKLKQAFKVQLVFPDSSCPDAGPHKQWVNLRARADQPDHGSLLKVRVKVRDEDGPSRSGDEVFLKLEYPGEGLSNRRRPARGVRGGAVQGWSSPMLGVSKRVARDGGEVLFEVELGKAGGDTVTIHVGGTEACDDDSIEVVNWRKLYYHLIRPAEMPPHSFEQTDTWLEEAFVVYERFRETTFTREESTRTLRGVWFTGRELGRDDPEEQDQEFFLLGDHNQDGLKRQFDRSKGTRSICLILAGALGDAGAGGRPYTMTAVKELSAAEEDVPLDLSGEVYALPHGIDDAQHPFVSGTWTTVGATPRRSGPMNEDMVIVEKASWKVKVRLPASAPNDPGRLVGGAVKIRVRFRIKIAYVGFGGRSSGQYQIVRQIRHPSVFNHIITHELGHNMNQAVTNNTPPPRGMDPSTHDYFYEGHGHVGPHCSFGFDGAGGTHVKRNMPDGTEQYDPIPTGQTASQQPDYSMVFKQQGGDWVRALGTCIMFGGLDRNQTTSQATDGICEHCAPFFKAESLEDVT